MPSSLFDAAKARILGDIERYFPDGERRTDRADGWWWRRRPDDKTPSCHVVGDGPEVKDFGDDSFRGSVLDCYAEMRGVSALDAAKEIAPEADTPSDKPARPRASRSKEKVKPVLPVTDEALATLRQYVQSEWAIEHYGAAVLGSRYCDAQGRVLFCIARYEKQGKKTSARTTSARTASGTRGRRWTATAHSCTCPRSSRAPCPCSSSKGSAAQRWPSPGTSSPRGRAAAAPWTRRTGARSQPVRSWSGPTMISPGFKAAAAIHRRLPHARVLDVERSE